LRNPNEELEDRLTELDPPYQTKDELKVGRMLDQYGIPFFYQQPTIIYNEGNNEIWKPSFTLYSYGGAVIDYVAGESKPEQKLSRDKIYRYNQIPAVVLGPKDLERPNWHETLYEKLEQMYQRPLDSMRYAPVGTDG
jgi:hypothetical protein